MRVAVPSLTKGWRAFAGEVGIIVLGVLIALGFGQLAEEWNWRSRTRQAVADLRQESVTNFSLMAERVVVQPCIDVQLDRLRAYIAGGDPATARPAPIASTMGPLALRQPIDRPFQDDVWKSLTNDGTVSHFSRDGRQLMANFYWQIESMRALQKQGDAAVGRLTALLDPGPLDPATRSSLLLTLAEARFAGRILTVDAAQSMALLRAAGQEPPTAQVDQMIMRSATVGHCRAQRLPLDDWRKRVTREYADAGLAPTVLH